MDSPLQVRMRSLLPHVWSILGRNLLVVIGIMITGWRVGWESSTDYGLGMLVGGAMVITVGAVIASASTARQHAGLFGRRGRLGGSTPPKQIASPVSPLTRKQRDAVDEQDNKTRLSYFMMYLLAGLLSMVEGLVVMAVSYPGS